MGWIRSYRRRDLPADAVAGGTVAAMMIPQSMAYAHVGGFAPEVGLYVAVVPLLVYAALGRSSVLAVGPGASTTLLAGAGAARIDDAGTAAFMGAGALLTLIAGVLHVSAWASRLARLAPRISRVSLDGFLLAIAILIFTTQSDVLLGIPSGEHLSPITTLGHTLEHLGDAQPASVALGGATIVALALRRHLRGFPVALACLVAGTAAVALLGLDDGRVPVVGSLSSGLPMPSLPPLDGVGLLIVPALAITVISMVETSAVDRRIDPADIEGPSEVGAVGAANVAAGLFRGIPVTAAPTRSVVARDAGARTQLTGVIAALLSLALLAFGSGLLADLPLPVLAALVIAATASFFRPPMWFDLARADRPRLVIGLAVVVASLGISLEAGVATVVAGSVADWLLQRHRARRSER